MGQVAAELVALALVREVGGPHDDVVAYPSLTAMQAVVDPLVEADRKLGKIDTKHYVQRPVFEEAGRRRVRAEN